MRLHRSTPPPRAAFTLIELLTVVAIIGVLAAILVPVAATCRSQAQKSREVSAARQLMVGYALAADENRGRLLPGMRSGETARNETGGTITMAEVAKRWPHRLRPYLGDRFRGALYVNAQADLYDQLSAAQSGPMLDYLLSLSPTFGMNQRFVGGEDRKVLAEPVVTRFADAGAPSRLVAFVSARNRGLGENSGYFYVNAPAYWTGDGTLDPSLPEAGQDHVRGYVAFRHAGRAVVSFLDGHVALAGVAELRDMRLWSEQARLADDPAWRPALAD